MRLWWLIPALILAAGLAVLHTYALDTYLYWRFVWLDVPVHFVGGLAIAMLLIGVLQTFRPVAFLLLIVVAIAGWEVFEFVIQTQREANFVFDSSLDVLMGALGALVAYILARFTLWRSV